jgi:hypothetical protein
LKICKSQSANQRILIAEGLPTEAERASVGDLAHRLEASPIAVK